MRLENPKKHRVLSEVKSMKIVEVNDVHIKFSNNTEITFYHEADCCEWNFADFEQLENEAMGFDFDENLKFEFCEGKGFRFGDSRRMFFIPCYSDQNGYYSTDIEIWYKDAMVISGECEEID